MKDFGKVIAATAVLLLPLGGSPALAQGQTAAGTAEQTVRLPASAGRELELRIWPARNPAAVIVFSAGGGGQPAAYERMLRALAEDGFVVIAPVHADALARGDISGSGGVDSFVSRIEDLAIARGYVEATQPRLPLVVMGHSFGSLMSSLAIGAATPVGAQGDPAVKALVAFSSPGPIQGLISSETFRDLTAPVLVVTGDQDLVPGFATDWRSHRALFDDSSTPGSALMVVPGADHNLIANADDTSFAALVDLTATFIRATVLDDTAARARLSGIRIGGAEPELR